MINFPRALTLKKLKVFTNSKKSELQFLMQRAEEFYKQSNREALLDLQRLVMRPLQSHHMLDAYLQPDHGAVDSFDLWRSLGISKIPNTNESFLDFVLATGRRIEDSKIPKVKLGKDIVLPTCWHPSSIINVLGNIGKNRRRGDWKQDRNHSVIWFYPLNIFWVTGGNHSIMQGIILAEGEVDPVEGYDLSGLYPLIKFNGKNWLEISSGKKIGQPRYKELGYVFEIGRLLLKIDNSHDT